MSLIPYFVPRFDVSPYVARSPFDFGFPDAFFSSPLDSFALADYPSELDFPTNRFPTIHNLDVMARMPVTEVKDGGDFFQVLITPPPGMKKEDVKVDVQNEVLRVTGQHSESETTANSKRRSHQSFTRFFRVPATLINEAKITARWNGNRLELDLPKKGGSLERGRRILIEGPGATSLSESTEKKEMPVEIKSTEKSDIPGKPCARQSLAETADIHP